MRTVEIIAIGNELLIGQTLDTNTHWLCRRIADLGGETARAVMVCDDLDAIARELNGALKRGTNLIITTGGIGPTSDDRTLEAVAYALRRPLLDNANALAMIAQRYTELHARGLIDQPGLTDARRKMGRLPQGAQPIPNPVGGAPAVRLDIDSSTIMILPGVPGELKGIWQESLIPLLTDLFGEGAFLEKAVTTDCPDDSVLAPLLEAVIQRQPDVYIKSHVQAFGGGRQEIRVTFSMAGPTWGAVEAGIKEAMDDFEKTLGKAGFSLRQGDTGTRRDLE
jgi:molybdenum cofactor synthesis domain-containing protein